MFLVITILCVALTIFIVKIGTRVVARRAGRSVTERFEAAEALLNQGQLPAEWLRDPRLKDAEAEKSREILTEKLQELTTFFAHCPYFKDEETRAIMLERLGKIAEQWRTTTLQAWLTRESAPSPG